MFSMDSIYGYQNHIFSQMKNIDDFYAASPRVEFMASNPFMVADNQPSISLYNKKMEKAIRMANSLLNEVSQEIKTMDAVINKLANNGSKIKYEMEARANKRGLLSDKLAIIKTIGDFETKIKKSNDDDMKLRKDLNAGGINDMMQPFGQGTSTNDSFLSNMLNTDSSLHYNVDTTALSELNSFENNRIEERKQIQVNEPKKELPRSMEDIPNHVPTTNSPLRKEQVIKDNIEDEFKSFATLEDEPNDKKENNDNVDTIIINALGDKVPVMKEYNGDWNEGTRSSAKKTLENISIKENPDIKEFFKYNKAEKKGYMVFYNEKTKEEVKGGTHLPLKLLYPMKIDLRNNMVSTNLEYDYPILYTNEPTPKEISEEWDDLDNIYNRRQKEMQAKRNNEEDEDEDEEE